ncbi:hypothetical protein HMPREF1083_05506 [[Clostridium] clostridioforme 90A6]|jgi:putative iron-only hydrogenase system regulator|uniref:Iron-only hydrogenase system regulator n=2 Tax=Enterocloster clostridioformis TaxID=1531 RepID=R0B098_9FIRM|nr:hypothetical protein HMPREF9467_04699 [ [[Clostridium] clostridioforme 2_1_49FAA]ENZ21437.1 hypothetical protein HMPREF1087_05464 [[Clostridium] clostridioforme 90A1]ENZ57841.1 hypothetical protein HMPREF1083_05506 [[Clostridium] clostridioforme 90A6]KMW12001.1 hypothetical protein HMPREF9471_04277 [[Clostridium] clostridioforme WAL-7855]
MTVCSGYAFLAYPFFGIGRYHMQTRIAVIGIIVENKDSVESVNGLLHQYGQYIIGRLGLPYEKKKVNIISVVVDAPQDIISALSGKLGRLQGINSKALYSNIGS